MTTKIRTAAAAAAMILAAAVPVGLAGPARADGGCGATPAAFSGTYQPEIGGLPTLTFDGQGGLQVSATDTSVSNASYTASASGMTATWTERDEYGVVTNMQILTRSRSCDGELSDADTVTAFTAIQPSNATAVIYVHV